MSLSDNIIKNIEGYSSAMYSTWLYYKPARIMFDAGEGVSLSMRNFIFGIDSVFLTHGHYDHIGGLAGMIYSRASARGDKEKPLNVYYPAESSYARGWDSIAALQEYIRDAACHIKYDLNWVPVHSDHTTEVAPNVVIKTLIAHHANASCLSYVLCETRKRLRPEMALLPKEEMIALSKANGKDYVNEDYEKLLLAYSGDTSPMNPNEIKDVEVLAHEATFVGAEDRDRKGHSSVAEAIEVAHSANAGALILYHLSGRYTLERAIFEARKEIKRVGYGKKVMILHHSKMVEVFV